MERGGAFARETTLHIPSRSNGSNAATQQGGSQRAYVHTEHTENAADR